MPPVGVECEVKHKYATPDWAQPDFHKTKVMAYGNELVIFHNENTCNGKHESVGAISDYLFRKLETPQQREEREREESRFNIERLLEDRVNFNNSRLPKTISKIIYDAGYRKEG